MSVGQMKIEGSKLHGSEMLISVEINSKTYNQYLSF